MTEDVVRSLVISQQALGTEAVILMPHTRCGVLGLNHAMLRPRDDIPDGSVPKLDFHPMDDLRAAVAADLRLLRGLLT